MRVLKFAHLDYLKTSRLNYMLLLFPILAAVMLLASADGSALFAVGYCLFAGIVLAAFPYGLAWQYHQDAGNWALAGQYRSMFIEAVNSNHCFTMRKRR